MGREWDCLLACCLANGWFGLVLAGWLVVIGTWTWWRERVMVHSGLPDIGGYGRCSWYEN